MQESERIKEFAIGEKIGEGTYAEVFKARYLRDNRPCAVKRIKVYEMPAEERKKTQTEVELLKHLHHPNIIEFYEHFVCNTELFIVMELAEEGDLRRILNNLRNRGTPFQEIDIWRSLFAVASGVAFMHDNKIMHRDIKPANIYVTAEMKLKLGDLGLGRVLSTQSMQAQSLVGTPYYMAPEQVQGIPYDFKSDIWSLGCLTYEMAMLHSPFESMQQSNLAALAQSIVNCRYDPLPESYSQILRTIVGMMLHRDPRQRPTAAQVVQVAKGYLDQAGASAAPSGLPAASASPVPLDSAQPMTRTLPKVNVPQPQPGPAQPTNAEQKAQAALAEALQAGVTPRVHFTPDLIEQMVQLQKARPVNLLNGGVGIFSVFEDLGVMGRGKFSTVNRIAYRTTGKQFAMKQLSIYEMEADDRKECIKEVQLLQALNHPHIIRCYDVFVEEGQLCMVLELADQGDLNAVLNRQRGLQRYFSELEIWHYFLQVVDAIRAMHANRIMHRDVKPGNVFVTADRKLKVGDLGLGRLFGSRTAVVFSVVGTPSYMSPEVLKNQGYNFKSDIWALGCLLYELTALRTPFMVENSGNMYELGNMIIEGRKPPLPDIFSRELHVLVDRMLSLNPDARPTTEEIFQRSYEVYHALRSRQEYGASDNAGPRAGSSDVNMM